MTNKKISEIPYENYLEYKYPDTAKEWHPLKNVTINLGGKYVK